MRIRIIYWLALILLYASPCFAKEWRGIVPLRSTRADVIKLLGNPKHDWMNASEFFEADVGLVKLEWIDPNCIRKYLVEPASIRSDDLVLKISITLKRPMSAQELGLPANQTVYLHCVGHENDSWSSCFIWDSEAGLAFTTSKDGVTSLSYEATSKDRKAWKEQHPTCFPDHATGDPR